MTFRLLMLLLLFGMSPAIAQEAAEAEPATDEAGDAPTDAESGDDNESDDSEPKGDGISSPKLMSGMSVLGNEEAPKALVIIPWKSSEMGDDLSLSDTLDDRARPVDKEVFLRELSFYEIRSGKRGN